MQSKKEYRLTQDKTLQVQGSLRAPANRGALFREHRGCSTCHQNMRLLVPAHTTVKTVLAP